MRILFVRHGTSTANATGMVGTPDTPLTEGGLEQARKTGQDLKNEHVTKIVCSPFLRARQTAEMIASELGITRGDIVIIPDFYERRMGDLEGKPKQKETSYFYENDDENNFETQQELIERLERALSEIKGIASESSGTVVAVGHATSGFYFLQVAKGRKSFQEFDQINQMSNAEFVQVDLA
jgi:broad specificity phosphatase PhoE